MPAPGGEFLCAVTAAGAEKVGSTVMIQLTDSRGAFATRWFGAAAVAQREMLATALAALTTGLNVSAKVASTDEYSELQTIYVLAA